MAEAAGLAIGAVALASLFSTCIECFDYYQSAVDAEKEIKTALVSLDLEKTRLLIWGDQVGICKTSARDRSPYLDKHENSITSTLEQLQRLLSDADEVRDTYGCVRIQTERQYGSLRTRDDASRSFKRLFVSEWDIFKKKYLPQASNLPLRSRWAIRGSAKFRGLILDVRDLIDGLNPVSYTHLTLPTKRIV